MSDPLNTHSYDGQLNPSLLLELDTVQRLSLEEKRTRAQDLMAKIRIHPMAMQFLSLIVRDMGTAANIDSTNDINADDLICLCWNYRDNRNFIMLLEEQLLDMATGFCPQGRTHRLFQILLTTDTYSS
jgi:hypothetical protein